MSRRSREQRQKSGPEMMRRRMENSLPWSLSRWFIRLLGRRK